MLKNDTGIPFVDQLDTLIDIINKNDREQRTKNLP